MNKKGFTLTELLVTIGILAIMSLVVGVNMTSILRSTDKKEDEFNVGQIEKAACVYVDSKVNENDCKGGNYTESEPCTTITLKKLHDNGLISDDMMEGREKTKTVKVYYENHEKKCKY